MRGYVAFVKKELMEYARNGKLMILGILFLAFGIMNPAIAKLTPWMLDLLSEELANSGMAIAPVTVDALTSWAQFFKNIPMALIIFVLMCGSSFTAEYEQETLILVLTKGLARYKVLLAKSTIWTGLWTAGFWLCFLVTYGYNAYFWDNSVAEGLLPAVTLWWVFGVFTIAVMLLFSVLARSYGTVLLGMGGVVLASYLLGLLPKAARFVPTSLMNGYAVLLGAEAGEMLPALGIALGISAVCVIVSVVVFHKKQI